MTAQLRMIYDRNCPLLKMPDLPEGFELHVLQKDEWEKYFELRVDCGFDLWNDEKIIDFYGKHAIKDGIIVIKENSTGKLVASATAEYGELDNPAVPSTLGWVMTRPGYGGKGFGRAVSIAATKMLFDAGLAPVYLLTDDFRTAAVALYLKMQWKPWLFQDDMIERWQKLCNDLNYPEDFLTKNSITDI